MVSVTSHFSAGDSLDQQGVDAWMAAVAGERGEPGLQALRDVCHLALSLRLHEVPEGEEAPLKRGIAIADIVEILPRSDESERWIGGVNKIN